MACLMTDAYVPLLDLLKEVQERWSLDTKAAQNRIRDAHILGDLVLKIRHPDGWVKGLDRHQVWNVAFWRQLFDEGIIPAQWQVPRSRRITWERSRILGIRQNLDMFLGVPALSPKPPTTQPAKPTVADPAQAAPEATASVESPAPEADLSGRPEAEILPPGRRRPGPRPGAIDRFGEADRALFPEMTALMTTEHLSRLQAARQLANAGKVSGIGTPESRARRLADRYRNRDEGNN
jgi:hypothetical protein